MKMVLESLEPKETNKFLKKKYFQHFGGFRTPQNPIFRFLGGLGGPETPQNVENIFFLNLLVSLGSKLSRTIFIFDFQFQEVFFKIFENFSYFSYLGTHEKGPKMAKKHLSRGGTSHRPRDLIFGFLLMFYQGEWIFKVSPVIF